MVTIEASPVQTLDTFLAAVDHTVATTIDKVADMAPANAAFDELFAQLRQLATLGGKRVRPTFCYWGYLAGSGPNPQDIVPAAAAIELVHACALAHDDIMDASLTRRGLPTAHVAFGAGHGKRGWQGNSAHFGEAAAIMMGDLALVCADSLFANAKADPREWQQAFSEFTQMRIEVILGQYLDICTAAQGRADAQAALDIATLKTTKYTVLRPLLIGAAFAKASKSVEKALVNYAEPMGLAFQLRDDVLGAFGEPDVTGKPVGDDFREGKQTYLVAKTIGLATAAQQRELQAQLDKKADMNSQDVAAIRTLITETGALADTEDRIRSLAAQARAALVETEIPDEPAAALIDLTDKLAFRNA